MPRGRSRLFELSARHATEILRADNSDEEEDANDNFDEEDAALLEADEPAETGETVLTVIDDGDVTSVETPKESFSLQAFAGQWRKISRPVPTRVLSDDLGKVNIEFERPPNPIDVFEKVGNFSELINKVVIPESQRYAMQKGICFETNEDEIRAYIGLNVFMSYHKLPSVKDYWSEEPDLGVKFAADVMPRNRFYAIKKSLHFVDNLQQRPEKSDPSYDYAWKVRPLVEHFSAAFLLAMEPTQKQSIDEHMLKFKGNNRMKQYMPAKIIKRGFKFWCRNDSATGYCFELDLFTGAGVKEAVAWGSQWCSS